MVLIIQRWAQAVASKQLYINDTIDCLMFVSAGVQALLDHKSMDEMVHCGWLNGPPSVRLLINSSIDCIVWCSIGWSGVPSLMGMTAFGEIGHLPDSNDLPHYDSPMFGAIFFPKRNQKHGKYIYITVIYRGGCWLTKMWVMNNGSDIVLSLFNKTLQTNLFVLSNFSHRKDADLMLHK